MHGKLPTDDNLRARGCVVVSICILCYAVAESYNHLFLHCPFAVAIWSWLEAQMQCTFDRSSILTLLSVVPRMCSS